MYMHNVNDYLTALNDIIQAMAEANEFVAVKDEPEQEESEIEGCIYCIMEGAFENGGHSIGCPNGLLS